MAGQKIVGEIENVSLLERTWTVQNCREYMSASSPTFSIPFGPTQITNWQLHFELSTDPNKASMFSITNLDEENVVASGIFSIFDKDDTFHWREDKFISNSFLKARMFSRQLKPDSKHQDAKTERAFVSSIDLRNTLILVCSVEVLYAGPILEESDKIERLAVLDDIEKLFDNSKHSDVTLILPSNKKIHAHKNILSTRSSVFEAMFEHDMKENRLNTVSIVDIKYDIMKELLRFIYTGKVDNIKAICRDLLVAADKYGAEGLKVLCEKTICGQLNVDNALESLQLAIRYNATVLQARVYGYIVEHIQVIRQQPELKQMDSEIKDKIIEILADKVVSR